MRSAAADQMMLHRYGGLFSKALKPGARDISDLSYQDRDPLYKLMYPGSRDLSGTSSAPQPAASRGGLRKLLKPGSRDLTDYSAIRGQILSDSELAAAAADIKFEQLPYTEQPLSSFGGNLLRRDEMSGASTMMFRHRYEKGGAGYGCGPRYGSMTPASAMDRRMADTRMFDGRQADRRRADTRIYGPGAQFGGMYDLDEDELLELELDDDDYDDDDDDEYGWYLDAYGGLEDEINDIESRVISIVRRYAPVFKIPKLISLNNQRDKLIAAGASSNGPEATELENQALGLLSGVPQSVVAQIWTLSRTRDNLRRKLLGLPQERVGSPPQMA